MKYFVLKMAISTKGGIIEINQLVNTSVRVFSVIKIIINSPVRMNRKSYCTTSAFVALEATSAWTKFSKVVR